MCSGTDNSSSSGNMIALLEGIFFAFMSVGAKKSAGTNPLGLTAIANLVTGIFVFTAFPSTAGYMRTLSAGDWTVLLILGIIQIGKAPFTPPHMALVASLPVNMSAMPRP